MALAGHALTLSSSTDDSSYAEIDGVTDFSFGPNRDMLETTDFADTTGAKTRMAGLKDGAMSISGDYEASDTGQARLVTQWGNGGACYIKALWNGSAGHKVLGIVENFSIKASVGGKVTFEASILFNGVFSAV